MKTQFLTTLLFVLLSASLYSQDFVHTPTNPAFGGSYFNYNWMLSSAQAQNGTKDPDAIDRSLSSQRNALDDFTNSLNRQLLNQISRNILNDQFGTDGFQPGTFTVGDYTIDVADSLNGLTITIIDLNTGNRSVIEIPNL